MESTILLIVARELDYPAEELAFYPDVFSRLVKSLNKPFRIRVHNITQDSDVKLLDTDKLVVIGGSPHCLDEKLPWMKNLKNLVVEAHKKEVKVLGICFGHQVVAEALGGKVLKCPRGGEVGIVDVQLTEAGKNDPLFKNINSSFYSLAAHRDSVIEPPPGATVLARNESNEYQALSIGPNITTVQFHPEMTTNYLRKVVINNKKYFVDIGLTKNEEDYQALIESLGEKPASYIIMRSLMNFLEQL